MRIVVFCHSLVSDWKNGDAHFLRGVVTELMARGHDVEVFEPRDNWSRRQLELEHGAEAILAFGEAYPLLSSTAYDLATLDLDAVLAGCDLVIVHEWNAPELIARVGSHRARSARYVLLFHDTHHRSITDPASLSAFELRHYDGVLASGDAVAHMYVERGWSRRAWTWHEAADVRVFYPRRSIDAVALSDDDGAEALDRPVRVRHPYDGDIVWIGNFGDEERTVELEAFLLEPVRRLGARAAVYGVGYPDDLITKMAATGIEFRGWLANHLVPEVFAQYKVTVHIPRAPYVASLPGIPTIRPFEAAACGIPFVSARWQDAGGLFTPGEDFLVAHDTDEMTSHLQMLLTSRPERARLARHAFETVQACHTCAHRVDTLLDVYHEVRDGEHRQSTMAPLLVPAS